jgi:universal stress protein E|tara:strand:- start:428 stop:1366 length:939 start_codon:yes stop_codon:yes gene_type:complete
MPKILAVIDPEHTEHLALTRIKELPTEGFVFQIEFFMPKTFSAQDATGFTKEMGKIGDALNLLVKPLIDLGYNIETQITLFDRLYEAIIERAEACNVDYVFKPLRHHGALSRSLFTPTDWNLVRMCPCLTLFISQQPGVNKLPVLASVDVANNDKDHKELNEIVINQSRVIAGLIGADVHLANAYDMMTGAIGGPMPDPTAYQMVQSRRQEHVKEAGAMAKAHDIPEAQVHLSEGPADRVINRFAEKIGAGIIVVGTVARSGIAGLFIGNTAESLIENADCDVFVVKPSSFKSPVTGKSTTSTIDPKGYTAT